jgi:hypothetical protein
VKDGVRRAAVAGTWYPGDAATLAAEIDRLGADLAQPPFEGRLVALISPHAGLRYSGAVAAHAYALLKGRSDLTAVLVGPSHRAAFDGFAVWAKGGFESPLGSTPIDEELATAFLEACPRARPLPSPHGEEHSLEMQLPFLQRWVPGLRLVPILMAEQSRAESMALAAGLAAALSGREDVVLVASSDLSHYQPAAIANRLDAAVAADVSAFDADALMDRLERAPGHACGGGPMVAVMTAARALGATRAHVLRYADSGDAGERNKSRVVGYLAAALLAP